MTQVQEREIIIVRIGEAQHYVVKGDGHLSQMMLVKGTYPTPIACLHFDDVFQAKMTMGPDFNPQTYWQIHPDIVARLRSENVLMEPDAQLPGVDEGEQTDERTN